MLAWSLGVPVIWKPHLNKADKGNQGQKVEHVLWIPRRCGERVLRSRRWLQVLLLPEPPNCPLRHQKYHLIETRRPLIEIHWGSRWGLRPGVVLVSGWPKVGLGPVLRSVYGWSEVG